MKTEPMLTPEGKRGDAESLIQPPGEPSREMLDDAGEAAEGDLTPADQTQGTAGGIPEAEHPGDEGEPTGGDIGGDAGGDAGDAGAEGGPDGEPSSPRSDRRTNAGSTSDSATERLFAAEEFQQLQRARERLDRLQTEASFLDAFLSWAGEHPEGGVCTIHGRVVGEFSSEQLARATDTARRRLNGVEMDRRLAEERLEQAATGAMSRVMQTARVIAPGLFVQGHAQQRAAQAIVAGIPESTRRAIEGDPAANLVLALAVRGLDSLRQASPRKAGPSPTRSVAATGTSGGQVEVDPTKQRRQQMVKRLIEGRGSVAELAALLR